MKFYSKEQLENSRIFYDKNPPKYMILFIIFVTILLLCCMIASNFIAKLYIVECTGIVDNRKSFFLTSKFEGEINQIYSKEGDYVNKGDPLFDLSIQVDNISKTQSLLANNDGVIHYYFNLKNGAIIQQNEIIAEISNTDIEDPLIVKAQIPAKDISKVKEGQYVKINVLGVNSQKYGLLSGEIEQISEIAEGTVQNPYDLYYTCTIKMENTILYSPNDQIIVKRSMPVVVQIIYDKETYWQWFMEVVFNIIH